MKKIYSVDSVFGGSDIYDENGNHIGFSVPGIGGGKEYYWRCRHLYHHTEGRVEVV